MEVLREAVLNRSAKPDSLEDLVNRLRKHSLRELKLGWHGSDFLNSPRHTGILTRAIKQNRSLQSVSIGWRHHHRSSLVRLLRALAKSPTRLSSINLVLGDWIPSDVLQELIRAHQSLVHIHFSCVQVHSRDPVTGQWCCPVSTPTASSPSNSSKLLSTTQLLTAAFTTPSNTFHQHASTSSCDHSPITQVIVHQYHSLPHWKTLSLIDCDLTDADVLQLADFCHIRGGLATVCLRGNRRISGKSLQMLCQAPILHRLDVSLCELDASDALCMAAGLARRPWPLTEFAVAGNYRMGGAGVVALCRAANVVVHSLDVSYCSVPEPASLEILQLLSQQKTLKSVSLHGVHVGSDAVAMAVKQLLRGGGLRTLALNDPNEPKCMSAAQLRTVLEGLKENYDMTDLRLDSLLLSAEERKVRGELDFWLRLNHIGRGVVRSGEDWYQVLEDAGNENLDSLYWIVRQSPGRFHCKSKGSTP